VLHIAGLPAEAGPAVALDQFACDMPQVTSYGYVVSMIRVPITSVRACNLLCAASSSCGIAQYTAEVQLCILRSPDPTPDGRAPLTELPAGDTACFGSSLRGAADASWKHRMQS
jgi:hypothetical protein